MTRESRRLPLRYGICFLGISIMALGISLITRVNLGTTPISALPYVASLGLPASIGVFTIVFNFFLVICQILILRRDFPRLQFLQIPLSCLFGFFIDIWMFLLPDFSFLSYAAKLSMLAAGTVVLALGVFLEVSADVVMMAGEGAVKALAMVFRRDFGMLKIVFDVTLVACGTVLSLYLFHELRGIGEGTFISAISVGLFVKMFHSLRRRLQ